MKKLYFILALLLIVACEKPMYKLDVLTNDCGDTLYVVSEFTVSPYIISDRYWYDTIYKTHAKDSAWTFYKIKIKEWEKERYK